MSSGQNNNKQEKLILLPEYSSDNPNNHENIICDFIIKETLGKGSFGVVKSAINTQTGEKVAIKILNEAKIPYEYKINSLREIEIMKNLKHPNIIRFYGYINKDKQLYLITEYIKGIELFQYISLKKKIEESEACIYFQQIISGIEYLHKMDIVHRDLKPENILIDRYLKEVKIIDFGLSNKYTDKSTLLSTLCGSPLYAAPEVLLEKGYKPGPVDIWSAGVILYFMISGKLPFNGDSDEELYKNIIDAKVKNIKGASKEVNDLIKKILNPNPRKRITISKIKNHPWFNLFDNNNFENLSYYGILINKYVIPVDEEIVEEMKKRFEISDIEIRTSILGNKLNDISTLYYLIAEQRRREGKISISDFNNEIFINYTKDENNLLKKYGNDINKVIKMRKYGIEQEKKIRADSNSKSKLIIKKKVMSLERENSDEKKDIFRSLSPSLKSSNNIKLFNNNTAYKSPKIYKSIDEANNSNLKLYRINTEVDSIKHNANFQYKKIFTKSNTSKTAFVKKNKIINSPVYQKRKIGKIISNKNGNSVTEIPSTNNNRFSQVEKLNNKGKENQDDKIEIKRKKNEYNQNPINNFKNQNVHNKLIDINKTEIITNSKPNSPKGHLSTSLHISSTLTKREEKKNMLKQNTGLLYKKRKISKHSERSKENDIRKPKIEQIKKSNINNTVNNCLTLSTNDKLNNKKHYINIENTNNEELSDNKGMNRYLSQDLSDAKNRKIKPHHNKTNSGNIFKMKKDDKIYINRINSGNNLFTSINNNFNINVSKEKLKILLNMDRDFSKFSLIDNKDTNQFIDPFDLNNIYFKKKGLVKKELLENLEKKKIRCKKLGNYWFSAQLKKDASIEFEFEIKGFKNSLNNLSVLKIKKVKGTNNSIFNYLKKVLKN